MKNYTILACRLILSTSIIGLLFAAGCNTVRGSTSEQAVVDQAAAEATAIIQRAQATALVLKAQAQATMLIHNANIPALTPDRTTPSPTPVLIQGIPFPQDTTATLQASTTETQAVEEEKVELVGVSLGTETGLILVQFKAPPTLTRHWQQGNVYVTDEASGAVYNEIPVAPIIGPLFARPKQAGQLGYVMLVNAPVPLSTGAMVTVVLGDFKQEHVIIQ